MPRNLSTSTLNAFRRPRAGWRWMLRFDFDAPVGSVGFWSGSFDVVHDGVTFRPGGVLEVAPLSWSDGGHAQQVEVSLRSTRDRTIPDAEDVFASIETVAYIGRPVRIYDYILDAEGRLVEVLLEWSGTCGPVQHEHDTDKGTVRATMVLESDSYDLGRRETATFSPALLRSIFPGDAGLDAVAVAGTIKIDLK